MNESEFTKLQMELSYLFTFAEVKKFMAQACFGNVRRKDEHVCLRQQQPNDQIQEVWRDDASQ
jgi:hypothetical protein